MSQPVDIDKYMMLMPLDKNELAEQHISPKIQERVMRLRALHSYWMQFPSKRPQDLVEYCMRMFSMGASQAYYDVNILQICVGNLNASNKAFARWRVNQMIEADRIDAKRDGDHRAVASMQKNYILNNMTDKEDTPDLAFDQIVILPFRPTEDPTAAGVKPIKDLRARIKKLEQKYGMQDIEYTDFEEMGLTDNEPSSEALP